MKSKVLVVCWREPELREWIPVGRLWQEKQQFFFCYTQGLKKAQQNNNFSFFTEMTDPTKTYFSDELFPIFQNRLLSKSRPEYKRYLEWLALDESLTALDELSRTNGARATDSLLLFEIPQKTKDGKYRTCFFAHGTNYLPKSYLERVEKIQEGEQLYLMQDIQNKADKLALLLRTDDPMQLLGYCPRIYTKDVNKLLNVRGSSLRVRAKRVNQSAPLKLKLLCEIEANWPSDFEAFDAPEFKAFS